MSIRANMSAKALWIGLTVLSSTGAVLAQECNELPVTDGCTVNGVAGVPCNGTPGNDVIEGTFLSTADVAGAIRFAEAMALTSSSVAGTAIISSVKKGTTRSLAAREQTP